MNRTAVGGEMGEIGVVFIRAVAEEIKNKQNVGLCEREGWVFCPLAIETTGDFGGGLQKNARTVLPSTPNPCRCARLGLLPTSLPSGAKLCALQSLSPCYRGGKASGRL